MGATGCYKIFAYDAAAANATFAFGLARAREGHRVEAYPRGPAEVIFREHAPTLVAPEPPRFERDDVVVTGLSGQHTRYELEMIRAAREARVGKIISILDIPFNIDPRFQRDGRFVGDEELPDEIWVPAPGDPSHREASCDERISRRIVERDNPYWEYLKEWRYRNVPAISDPSLRELDGRYVLYLTDYIAQTWKDLGFTEFSVLEEFLMACRATSQKAVVVHQHPAEAVDKYDRVLAAFSDLDIRRSAEPLHVLVSHSRAVYGALSSVFYESALIGKPTFSVQIGAVKPRVHLPKGVPILLDRDALVGSLRGLS